MATITNSIGSGARDYSTVQLWEDALPANLVTDGNSYVGECYNDSEFSVAGSVVIIAGETTDATHTITLTTGSGQSFRDNASVQTNALRYNQSNGVALKCTDNYQDTVSVQVDNVTIRGLQIAYTGATGKSALNNSTSETLTGIVVEFCILEATTTGYVVFMRAGKIRNSLIVNRNSGTGSGMTFQYSSTTTAVNVTIVRPSDKTAAGDAIHANSGTAGTLKNIACFGFTNEVNNSALFTATTCATDKASPMTGFTGSLTYANQFENLTDATRDFRAKSGADLLNNGTTDTTNAPIDIAGTARPQGAAYDIGAWELVVASTDKVPYSAAQLRMSIEDQWA